MQERLTERALSSNIQQLVEDTQKWTLYDHVRIVHYKPGQEKTIHKDSPVNVNGKSARYTCILYLNDVPEGTGGRTISWPQHTERYRKSSYAPRPNTPEYEQFQQDEDNGNVLTTQPKAGKSAMYDVHLPHRGEALTSGEKWIAIFKVLI